MSDTPPLLDSRDAASLRTSLAAQLAVNVPGWKPVDPRPHGQPDETTAALIGVFARFSEIVIQRLNQVPEKNFLAFLDLLGVSRLPPEAARVPLTFTLAVGSQTDAVVPVGTRAASAPQGSQDPVIFETGRELTVTAARLQTLIAADAERDAIADHSAVLANPPASGVQIFAGNRTNPHYLYIGHPALGVQNLHQVQIELDQHDPPPPAPTEIRGSDLLWERWDGTSWQAIVEDDVTSPTFIDGTFTFTQPRTVPPSAVAGVTSCWMRCHPAQPISPSATPVSGMACAGLLPSISGVRVSVSVQSAGIAPDAVLLNGQALDVTKPFQPFGDRPMPGDVLYIASREAFAHVAGSVTLATSVINPTAGAVFPPPTRATTNLQLRWEIWTNAGWTSIGTSTPSSGGSAPLTDDTRAFTRGTPNVVTFTVPAAPALTTLNGVTSYWVRVQIASGSYVVDPAVDVPVFAPPTLSSMAIGYQYGVGGASADVIASNNLEYDNVGPALALEVPTLPFRALPALPPALYLAFETPPERKAFPTRPISLYHGLRSLAFGAHLAPLHPDVSVETTKAGGQATHRYTLTNASAETVQFDLGTRGNVWPCTISSSPPTLAPGQSIEVTVKVNVPGPSDLPAGKVSDSGFLRASVGETIWSAEFETRIDTVEARSRNLRWEYWNGAAWAALPVVDDTGTLTQSGVVEFFGPGDIALASHFGVSGYWLRALFERGEEVLDPRVQHLLPNTTVATQAVTVLDELLGSSDASASQRFRTVRAPILRDSQQLEVRENDVPVAWTEVPDLYASGPQDSHYVLDHLTGEVLFGDGAQGRIPPRGAGNVRMVRYQTGGGSAGNVGAGAVVQMKTTVPYVEKVSNVEAAEGGADAEAIDDVIERAPRTLRHGGRAVAAQDYEDLARLASPEVARAKSVPVRRLTNDPLGAMGAFGVVSVIIVPDSTDTKPLPSGELLAHVEQFLRARQPATAEVVAVGPLYVRIDVVADVVLSTLEGTSRIEETIRARLAAFLHPLTGGRDGTGWDFGRQPHLSDLHAVIGEVPAVDHVRELSVNQVEELTGAISTGRFLVYSGQHQITLSFAPVT